MENRSLKLYKSSAGSGKTFTLVKEFLQICLPDPYRFSRVLAITFTNAAAVEMKERILNNLIGLIDGKAPEMRAALIKDGLRENDFANAPKLLEMILFQYSRFSIGTIDAFFHKILRSFSKELGLPMDFEIFLESKEVLEEAVDEFLHHSYSQKEHHAILVQFIRDKINSSSSWKIQDNLLQIAEELLKENRFLSEQQSIESIKEFISNLKKIVNAFEDIMDNLGKEALRKMEEHGVEVSQFKHGNGGAANQFRNILKTNRNYELKSRFLNALEDTKDWVTAKAPHEALLRNIAENDLLPLALKVVEIIETKHREYATALEVMRHIFTYAIYDQLNANIENYREKNEVVLISDFTKVLAKHLVQEDVSFIYSKVGTRYEHYLIDEFQDTSLLQWISLKPLVENAISQGQACLVVGDSKQAIYRWRGGNVALIENIISDIDFPEHTCKLMLTSNFRSQSTIVQFNNQFFDKLQSCFNIRENNLLEKIYKDAAQIDARKNSGGYVQVNMLAKSKKKEDFVAASGEVLIENIRQCLSDGFSLRDIAILIRTKGEAEEVAMQLLKENIKFITQDSLYLDHSPAVRLLFSLLHFVTDQRNKIARIEVIFIYYTYFCKSKANELIFTDILREFEDSDIHYSTLLPEEFLNNLDSLCLLPVYELTEELVRIFGLADEPNVYIERLQDVVFEYSLTKGNNIKGFLEWYKNDKYTIVLPDTQDAVRILTIHKSKGLEFPVVMLPFANWNFKPPGTKEIIWVRPEIEPFNQFEYLPVGSGPGLHKTYFDQEQQLEESMILIDNINLLYVANTRAISRLYVISEKLKVNESYNNIAQVITTTLLNNNNDVKINEKLVFGEPTSYEKPIKTLDDHMIIMENYPAYDWRKSLKNGFEKEEKLHKDHASNQFNSKEEFLINPKILDIANQNGIVNGDEIIFPGKGSYRPLGTMISPDKGWLITSKFDEKELISLYSGYLSCKISKPVEIISI